MARPRMPLRTGRIRRYPPSQSAQSPSNPQRQAAAIAPSTTGGTLARYPVALPRGSVSLNVAPAAATLAAAGSGAALTARRAVQVDRRACGGHAQRAVAF